MATYPPHLFYLPITTPSFDLSLNVSVHLCIHSSIGPIGGVTVDKINDHNLFFYVLFEKRWDEIM